MRKIVGVLTLLFTGSFCFGYGMDGYSRKTKTDKPVVNTVKYDHDDVTDAAVITVPFVDGVDLESIFKEIRIAELLTFEGDTYTGVYMPIASLKSDELELVNLVFGGAFKNKDAKGYPMVSVTLRVDGILGRVGALNWIAEHFHIVKFPAIEFGPFASYDFVTPQDIYGFLLAKKF